MEINRVLPLRLSGISACLNELKGNNPVSPATRPVFTDKNRISVFWR
jgi:hypothetical protein